MIEPDQGLDACELDHAAGGARPPERGPGDPSAWSAAAAEWAQAPDRAPVAGPEVRGPLLEVIREAERRGVVAYAGAGAREGAQAWSPRELAAIVERAQQVVPGAAARSYVLRSDGTIHNLQAKRDEYAPVHPAPRRISSALDEDPDFDPRVDATRCADPPVTESRGELRGELPGRRPLPWRISPDRPDLLLVPADATRAELTRALVPGATPDAVHLVSRAELAGTNLDAADVRAVRLRSPAGAPPELRAAQRLALDAALARDVQWTVDALVSGKDGLAVAERVLRWSQYSELADARGVSYFERYLSALDGRRIVTTRDLLVTTTRSERSAYEELLAETSGRAREMIQKAITARSTRDVGYRIEDPLSGPGAPGASPPVVGRWFAEGDGTPIAIKLERALGSAPTLPQAELVARNADAAGPRVVIPAGPHEYRAYAVRFDMMPGAAAPGVEGGRFAWYHPGTVFIGAGEFLPGERLGPERAGDGRAILAQALDHARRRDAAPLVGLDHPVLRLATVDERAEIFRRVLDGGLDPGGRGLALLARVILTTPAEEFAALERRLDADGSTARLVGVRDPRRLAELAALGQAFTAQTLATVPLGAGALTAPLTLEQGVAGGTGHFFAARAEGASSHVLARSEWRPDAPALTADGRRVEAALPREGTGDVARTVIRFTAGTYPDQQSDQSRWHRRSERELAPALPTDLVVLRGVAAKGGTERIVSAFEAALLQGDPRGEAGSRDAEDFLDTLVLAQGAGALARLGSMGLRAAATQSLRAGVGLLERELASQAGRQALRGAADLAIFGAARYAQEHQEELARTPEGRAFVASLTVAVGILAARDLSHLVESGALERVVATGGAALRSVGGAAGSAVQQTVRRCRAAAQAWKELGEAGALELATDAGGVRILRPRSTAEFTSAFRVADARAAGEELRAAVAARGGDVGLAERVLGRLETAAGKLRPAGKGPLDAETAAVVRAYGEVAQHAATLPAARAEVFLGAVERALDASTSRAAGAFAPFLRAAVKAEDPVAFLREVEAFARSGVSRTAFAAIGAKAQVGTVDLAWLKRTTLSPGALERLASNPKTPWTLYRAASLPDAPLKITVRALARARGEAAEMVAEAHGARIAPGHRLDVDRGIAGRGVPAGDSEIDLGYIARDGTGHTLPVEVKGWNRESWRRCLDAYLAGDAGPDLQRLEHMFKQLNDAVATGGRAEGEAVVLVVTDGIGRSDVATLRKLVDERVHGAVRIETIPEAEIANRARSLRQEMGIR